MQRLVFVNASEVSM